MQTTRQASGTGRLRLAVFLLLVVAVVASQAGAGGGAAAPVAAERPAAAAEGPYLLRLTTAAVRGASRLVATARSH